MPAASSSLVVHLAVGGAGRVQARRCARRPRGWRSAASFRLLHEASRPPRARPSTPKRHHAAGAVRQVLLRQLVVAVAGQAADSCTHATFSMAAPGTRATAWPFSQCRGMRTCRLSRPRFRRKAFCGDWTAAEVAHELGRRLGDEGALQAEASRYRSRRGSSRPACVRPGNLSAWAVQSKLPRVHDGSRRRPRRGRPCTWWWSGSRCRRPTRRGGS